VAGLTALSTIAAPAFSTRVSRTDTSSASPAAGALGAVLPRVADGESGGVGASSDSSVRPPSRPRSISAHAPCARRRSRLTVAGHPYTSPVASTRGTFTSACGPSEIERSEIDAAPRAVRTSGSSATFTSKSPPALPATVPRRARYPRVSARSTSRRATFRSRLRASGPRRPSALAVPPPGSAALSWIDAGPRAGHVTSLAVSRRSPSSARAGGLTTPSTMTAEPPATTTSRTTTSMAAGFGRGTTACRAVSRAATPGGPSRAPSGSVPSARRSSTAVGF
jgi:hypothetical protein